MKSPAHACLKENDIDRLNKTAFTNAENIAKILTATGYVQADMGEIKEDVKNLITTIHGLQIFKAEIRAVDVVRHDIEEQQKDSSFNSWQKTFMIIGAMISAGGIIAAILIA